jgi:hypothetical protein
VRAGSDTVATSINPATAQRGENDQGENDQ